MAEVYDLFAQKPVSIWNRELSIDSAELFNSLGKAVVSGVFLDTKGIAENVLEAFKTIAPEDKPASAAWLLIYRSLQHSLSELVKEYREDGFFPTEVPDNQVESIAIGFKNALNDISVGLNAGFFDRPHQLPLLEEIKQPLIHWLIELQMREADALALHLRLKSRFVLSLHKEWLSNPNEYTCIEEALTSPFIKATKEKRDWIQYNAWLQEKADERMFAEAFSLKQVYVPLRAYYEEKEQDNGDQADDELRETNRHLKPVTKRIVVDLHDEVEHWVRNFDKDNAVRIISGGPGSGKSSFGKMFAAHVAQEITEVPVIFVPLHHFDPSDDLTSAVEQFIRDERFLNGSPLDTTNGEERLLIVFDGLDELSMQGKAAAETALHFVDEVITKIDKCNGQGLKRQVLLTGRDLAVQSAATKLRAEKQILHVLPYYLPKNEAKRYVDPKKLLEEDQRNQWWANYATAKGLYYESLPEELRIDRLTPITREPLLNYLVALSYQREQMIFSDDTTLNKIYEDLLKAVHERKWDHDRLQNKQHKGTNDLEINNFIRILEEIALAVWHGDGRTATINQIYQQCENSKLTRYLEDFQEGAKKGVFRLLTAFYFRQSEQLHAGDKTFEFTHKSFGEYLTARRIVRSIKQIHNGLQRHEEDPDDGFDEKEALKRWAVLCGPTIMDQYIFKFLCDEVAAYPVEQLKEWQKTFADLIGYTVRNGMPMEQLDIAKFKEMMRQSRNAEESLMVIHYACSIKTEQRSSINWGKDKTAFGEWVKRLQGQPADSKNRLIFNCLSYINLSGCILYISDFFKGYFKGSILDHANLSFSSLTDCNLENCSLKEVNIEKGFLIEANLSGASLIQAELRGADLTSADLIDTDLTGADFTGAILCGADLTGANLDGANFDGANLTDAILPEGFVLP